MPVPVAVAVGMPPRVHGRGGRGRGARRVGGRRVLKSLTCVYASLKLLSLIRDPYTQL